MTVSSIVTPDQYTGNAVTTSFPITWAFTDMADSVVLVSVDGVTQTLNSDYTISSENVVFTTAPASGVAITIKHNPDFLQETDYTSNDAFPANSHEGALDKLARAVQFLKNELRKAIRIPDEDPVADDPELAAKADRANTVLGFDASGDLELQTQTGNISVPVTVGQGGTGATTAATARSNLGVPATGDITASGLTQATARLLGRTTAAVGAVEEISVDTSLTLSSGTLSGTAASTTQAGVIETATQAEMEAASDALKAATAGNLNWHPGVAKFWLSAGTTGNILASHNVASVSDVETGVLDVTFDTDFSSANWKCGVSVEAAANTRAAVSPGNQNAGSVRIQCSNQSTASTTDPSKYFIDGFGDQ